MITKKNKNWKKRESELRELEAIQIQSEAEKEFIKIIDEIYPNQFEEEDLEEFLAEEEDERTI